MDQQPSPAPEAPPEPELTPEEERQEQVDYLKNIVRRPPAKKSFPKWPILIVVIIIIGVVGVVLAGHKSPAKPATKAASTAPKIAPTQTSGSIGTTNYVSNGKDLNLRFDYPSSWTVLPVSGGNTTDQPISATSPLVSITSAAGQSVTGKVVLQIRPASAQLSELGSGTTAAQASVQYAYSKPTAAQHKYFYLTFVHATAASNPAGSFQEVFVTGISTFNTGDALTPDSISVDPIISASFYSCASATCSGSSAVPLSITNATWMNAAIFKQTLSALESLQLN